MNDKIHDENNGSAGSDRSDAEFERELSTLLNEDSSKTKKRKKIHKKWSRKKKMIVGAAAVAVVLFGGSKLSGGGKGPAAPMVPVSTLAKGDIVQKLSVNGPVSGTDSAEVVSNLHSEIMELTVKEGDRVAKDQVLAVLDSEDLQKQVDIAQNAYDLAITTYNEKNIEAENDYAKAVQDYQTAKAEYERQNALFQAGGAPAVDLERARNAANDAKRLLSTFNIVDGKARANDSYALDVKNKAFDLDQKKTDLNNSKVKSPIDGTVVRVNCKVGRFADKTDDDKPMFMIDNLDVLEMKINVSEYSIGKVEIGQSVTISADILGGETVRGEVTAISPTGEEKGGGSTERVIPTTVRILDQNTKLIAGITAKAEIMLAESKDTWIVPISALLQMPDGSNSIQVVENNTIRTIPVNLGVESDIEVEIIEPEGTSLTEGMQIVTMPNVVFTDGMTVTPMPGA